MELTTYLEKRLASNLLWMSIQYLSDGIDSPMFPNFMSAGENALDLLEELGIVHEAEVGYVLTQEGKVFCDEELD